MRDLTPSQIVLFTAILLFSIAAAITDIRTRRIPNKLTAPMCLAGFLYQISFFSLDGLWTALLGFGAGFGALFVLWMVGTAGGGDVKLMGALGPWLGAMLTLKVLLVSLIFVTVGTVGIVLFALCTKGLMGAKSHYLKSGPAAETSDQRQKRRVMPFAAPVALAIWCLLAIEVFGNKGS